MGIARRHVAVTAEQKHAWRIENARQHINHFKKRKDAHRLTIWKGVLAILESRTPAQVRQLEKEAMDALSSVNNVFTAKARIR